MQQEEKLIANVVFTMLMYGLYLLLKFTSLVSSEFKEKLREKDVILIMKSRDEKIARKFDFTSGKVSSKTGIITDSSCSLIWKNPSIGSKVMIDIAKGNTKAIGKSVINGTLQVAGDAKSIKWFLEIIRQMRGVYLRRIEE